METVHMEKRGDYYVSFREDAYTVKRHIPDTVIHKHSGMDACSTPAHSLDRHVHALNEAGVTVKICCSVNVRMNHTPDDVR